MSVFSGVLFGVAIALNGLLGAFIYVSNTPNSLILVLLACVVVFFAGAYFLVIGLKQELSASKAAEQVAVNELVAARLVANRDFTTGLYNRTYVNERSKEILKSAVKRHETCAILYLDLDNFKIFNEALGHELGNKLLASVAHRLRSAVKQSDIVGYYGSDQFLVVLPKIDDVLAAEIVARRIINELVSPFEINSQQYSISSSIGIAIGPVDGSRSETLISHAESALKERKLNGRKGYTFYSKQLNEYASNQLSIDQRLRGALKRDEFSLVYQPIVSQATGEVKAFEALIRWQSDELGFVSPAEFIPIAEQIGLISEIGNWVLHEACAQLKHWQHRYNRPLTMSINVSPRQFHDKTILPAVKMMVEQMSLLPKSIRLEVTEGLLLNSTDAVNEDMNTLNEMGIQLALDDFGTGYSSLSYLNKLTFDVLKVDKCFVDGVCTSERDHNMIESIISIAHTMGMEVVVEGVETAEQANELSVLKADAIQGYYYSRPLPAEEAEALFLAKTLTDPH